MSKYVVSANYRNRESEDKWLMRRSTEGIEKAVPTKRLVATGVEFIRSDIHAEDGWDCKVVAACDNVEFFDGETTDEEAVPIHFDGWAYFYRGDKVPDGTYPREEDVISCLKKLYLNADGSMLAVLGS